MKNLNELSLEELEVIGKSAVKSSLWRDRFYWLRKKMPRLEVPILGATVAMITLSNLLASLFLSATISAPLVVTSSFQIYMGVLSQLVILCIAFLLMLSSPKGLSVSLHKDILGAEKPSGLR